jgi:hypothetical protein
MAESYIRPMSRREQHAGTDDQERPADLRQARSLAEDRYREQVSEHDAQAGERRQRGRPVQ